MDRIPRDLVKWLLGNFATVAPFLVRIEEGRWQGSHEGPSWLLVVGTFLRSALNSGALYDVDFETLRTRLGDEDYGRALAAMIETAPARAVKFLPGRYGRSAKATGKDLAASPSKARSWALVDKRPPVEAYTNDFVGKHALPPLPEPPRSRRR